MIRENRPVGPDPTAFAPLSRVLAGFGAGLAFADGSLVPDFARHEGEELTGEGHHVALTEAACTKLAVDVLRENCHGLGITFDCFAQCFCHD